VVFEENLRKTTNVSEGSSYHNGGLAKNSKGGKR
jgi:hypothetical protein